MGQSSNCHCFRIGSQFNCHWGSTPHFQTIPYHITCDTWYVYETHRVRRIVDHTRNIPKKTRQRGSRMSKRWIDEMLPHTSHTFLILSCTFSTYLGVLAKNIRISFHPTESAAARLLGDVKFMQNHSGYTPEQVAELKVQHLGSGLDRLDLGI